MSKKGYNGYRNWETWNVALWFANDENLYRAYRATALEKKFTPASAKDFVLGFLPNGTPDMSDLSPGQLHSAYAKVAWGEIARNFNEK